MKSFVERGWRESIYKGSELSTKYGSFWGRVCIGIETVRRRNPNPKSIQLHRVETLGQTFFGAANPNIYFGYTFAAATGRISLSFSPTPHSPHTPQALVLLRNDVAQACLYCTSAFPKKPAPT
jgi:hypothetical protein